MVRVTTASIGIVVTIAAAITGGLMLSAQEFSFYPACASSYQDGTIDDTLRPCILHNCNCGAGDREGGPCKGAVCEDHPDVCVCVRDGGSCIMGDCYNISGRRRICKDPGEPGGEDTEDPPEEPSDDQPPAVDPPTEAPPPPAFGSLIGNQ